jgi:CheY-like chemotaxis protein
MVNAIVQNVGGKITIADRIGGGSVFTVWLPSARPDLAQRDDNVHAVGVTSSTTKREATELPRVMLVDDNEMLNTTVSSHLTSLGYAVKGHTSSAKALEELRESSRDFEILISDQSMPEFDGISLAYQVREFDPELPVILITGFSHLLTLELSKKLDICHVLAKPISVKAIAKAIDFYARQRYETTAGPK